MCAHVHTQSAKTLSFKWTFGLPKMHNLSFRPKYFRINNLQLSITASISSPKVLCFPVLIFDALKASNSELTTKRRETFYKFRFKWDAYFSGDVLIELNILLILKDMIVNVGSEVKCLQELDKISTAVTSIKFYRTT